MLIRPILLLVFALLASCTPTPVYQAPTGDQQPLDELSAISRYLDGRDLAPIEGIWNWSDNSYQVVITRNETGVEPTYEYVGIVTRTNRPGWEAGQVKLLIDATAAGDVFTGRYFGVDQRPVGTSFILTNPNLIEAAPPLGAYGGPLDTLLIRSYPRDSEGNSFVSSPGFGSTRTGTCFAASPGGLLITSHHVVDGAVTIEVQLSDGRTLPARVASASRSNDIALLQIDEELDSYLTLAAARSARAGDAVFTMGYPNSEFLGVQPKFTEGAISAMSGLHDEPSYLQMSVPIQPGNSGGPVVNERGEVVGVVAATAAVESFYQQTGSLPQNVNWAVKAEYAQLLFDPPEQPNLIDSRRKAIDRTANSICRVIAE